MCKPLRGKIELGLYGDCHTFDVDDVKSACEFYKKYRWDWLNFEKDFPNQAKKISNSWTRENLIHKNPDFGFQEWLFDYCFGDVI